MEKYSEYFLVCVIRTVREYEILNKNCILCSKIKDLENDMVLIEIPYKLTNKKETLYNREMQKL